MKRHEYREKILFALYQHLLLKNNLRDSFDNNFQKEDYDEFLIKILTDLEINMDSYKEKINGYLNKWSFDRLSYIDQSILLAACSEISLGLNDKPVIIDEAVILSKKYSDEESYKYINGVLDKL